MKKLLVTSFLFFFLPMTMLSANPEFEHFLPSLGHPDTESHFSFSQDKLSEKKRYWATYTCTFGKENVRVKLPGRPKLTNKKGLTYLSSKERDVLYTLVAGMPPVEKIDPKEAFFLSVATLCQHPNKLHEYTTTKQKGMHTLDMFSEDTFTDAMTRTRMIITPRNFYILRTTFWPEDKENHDLFVDSFSITTKK